MAVGSIGLAQDWTAAFLSSSLSIPVFTAIVILGSFLFLRHSSERKSRDDYPRLEFPSLAATRLIDRLAAFLPEDVVLSQRASQKFSTDAYWAQQECEITPSCVIQPRNDEQLRFIIKTIHEEHVRYEKSDTEPLADYEGLFAVRGGGHNVVAGAANLARAVVVDLGALNEVVISEDRQSVSVGSGARWSDVSSKLDQAGLAAVGGRNSHVGVGGLTLGGGISFFSPQYGFVCSNVIEYEVILASGEQVTASKLTNPDLWRALKGGGNNFGVVTRFTLRCFPSKGIWAGWLYIPGNQADKVVAAVHRDIARADPKSSAYDDSATGPMACFSYVQSIGLTIIAVSLVYTKTEEVAGTKKWPAYWKESPLGSIWRLWNTCKLRSLTDATDELNALSPPGFRQVAASTTVKNDLATLAAAHKAFRDTIGAISRSKGMIWTMVLQPLVPAWARKGDPNSLGLDEGTSDPLVIVEFTIAYKVAEDDGLVRSTVRLALDQINAFAESQGTAHRYRYLNYASDWQDPLASYGQKNREFLREVSREYDPDGLFQRGCPGGFKLWDRSRQT